MMIGTFHMLALEKLARKFSTILKQSAKYNDQETREMVKQCDELVRLMRDQLRFVRSHAREYIGDPEFSTRALYGATVKLTDALNNVSDALDGIDWSPKTREDREIFHGNLDAFVKVVSDYKTAFKAFVLGLPVGSEPLVDDFGDWVEQLVSLSKQLPSRLITQDPRDIDEIAGEEIHPDYSMRAFQWEDPEYSEHIYEGEMEDPLRAKWRTRTRHSDSPDLDD